MPKHLNPFVKSNQIIRVINMYEIYKTKPSDLLGIDDPYTAFCFDEACAYIVAQIKDGKEPIFKRKYKSMSEMYQEIGF